MSSIRIAPLAACCTSRWPTKKAGTITMAPITSTATRAARLGDLMRASSQRWSGVKIAARVSAQTSGATKGAPMRRQR
jgi:hypothetical protein